jgi:hypothetical protein
MRIPWGIPAALVLVALVGNPVDAQETGPVRIAFKVKDLKGKSQAAKLKAGLTALESVEDCAVSLRSRGVVVVMKGSLSLKLSELRAAVKTVGKKLVIEEAKMTLAGACSVVTSLTTEPDQVIKALKSVKNVERAKPSKVDGKAQPGQFDVVTKQPKGTKLGAIQKALEKLRGDGTFETPAVTDIVWVAPAAKPKEEASGHG